MKKKEANQTHPYHHGDLRRALVEAAVTLMTDEQNWNFSLREVARKAGVSHNAPYNHFADKQELLAEVAAVGFAELRERMQGSARAVENPKTALIKAGVAYVDFGLENPARYRLMFGSVLRSPKDGRPTNIAFAAAGAGTVLGEIFERGAQTGAFPASVRKKENMQLRVLAAWSAVHGLTQLVLDGLPGAPKIPNLAEKVARVVCEGLVS
jgi:AcrR family transcriptional regulator